MPHQAEIPRHALEQLNLAPGAAQCLQTPSPRLTCVQCHTWMWPLAYCGQTEEKPPKTLQGTRGWEALGMASWLWAVITHCCSGYSSAASCGSKHTGNSTGGRVREANVKGYIRSRSLVSERKMPTISNTHTCIFSLTKKRGTPVFSSVLLHAFIFLKAAVPVTGYFLPSGWMLSAMCWVTHVQSSQFNCLNLQP